MSSSVFLHSAALPTLEHSIAVLSHGIWRMGKSYSRASYFSLLPGSQTLDVIIQHPRIPQFSIPSFDSVDTAVQSVIKNQENLCSQRGNSDAHKKILRIKHIFCFVLFCFWRSYSLKVMLLYESKIVAVLRSYPIFLYLLS